jgi:hypothetical protein
MANDEQLHRVEPSVAAWCAMDLGDRPGASRDARVLNNLGCAWAWLQEWSSAERAFRAALSTIDAAFAPEQTTLHPTSAGDAGASSAGTEGDASTSTASTAGKSDASTGSAVQTPPPAESEAAGNAHGTSDKAQKEQQSDRMEKAETLRTNVKRNLQVIELARFIQ